jgi:hypothetical protein
MRIRQILAALGVAASAFVAVPAAAEPAVPVAGTATRLTDCSAEAYHGDARLGPERLPIVGAVGAELRSYHRTGKQEPAAFLAEFYDDGLDSYRYPPAEGYRLDPFGAPIKDDRLLRFGTLIDRYGSEFGAFLAPAGSPYSSRSIPPSNLNDTTAPAGCNYHVYLVIQPFRVDFGPVAAWFEQPGGGTQYQLDQTLMPTPTLPADRFNVRWLVDNHFLLRLR